MNVPVDVAVPLMVIVLLAQVAVTPLGSPLGVPIPVAPVVVCVILVSNVFIQTVGEDEAGLVVLSVLTVIVPVAFVLPHPPVNGML